MRFNRAMLAMASPYPLTIYTPIKLTERFVQYIHHVQYNNFPTEAMGMCVKHCISVLAR